MVLAQRTRRPRERVVGGGGSDALPPQSADDGVELEVSSNRSNCLGVYGVAREVHGFSGATLAPSRRGTRTRPQGAGARRRLRPVTVDIPSSPRGSRARVFTEVTIGPSPLWLKARLMAAGQRPINNVVDLTNYVMLLRAADARVRPRSGGGTAR